MKKLLLSFINKLSLLCLMIIVVQLNSFASDVTYTTERLAAGNLSQGTVNAPIYAFKIAAGATDVTIQQISAAIGGTYAATDISNLNFLYGDSPTLADAILLSYGNSVTGAGETVVFNAGNYVIPANTARYFFITANINASATDGHTIKVNGAANPIAATYSGAPPVITNSQTDIAGVQTIKAPTITYTSETVTPSNVAQGAQNIPIYTIKIQNTSTYDVSLQQINATINGTYASADISNFNFLQGDSPIFTDAILFAYGYSVTGAGETVVFSGGNYIIPASSTKYFFISANITAAAADGHTIKINGATNPIAITYSGSSPIITNGQTDVAGVQTIKAPKVTHTSETVNPATVFQGAYNVPVYTIKIQNTSMYDAAIQQINATTTGTYAATDITNFNFLYGDSPIFTDATLLAYGYSVTGAGETVVFSGGNYIIPANSTKYFFISADITAAATDGHTIKINGANNPLEIIYFGSTPIVTNNQTNIAGVQTIKAPTVTYTSETIPPSNVLQGTPDVPIYNIKIQNTSTNDVAIQQINATITGTYSITDIGNFNFLYGDSPIFTDATLLAYGYSTTGAGETVAFGGGNYVIPANSTKYFFISANIAVGATDGHTIKINGAGNPLEIIYLRSTPIVTNNQTNIAGKQTIGTPSFTYSTESSPAKIIARGTNDHPFYTVKLELGGIGGTVTNIAATTSGNYNGTDIGSFSLYKNSSPGIAGATLLATDVTSTGHGETLNFGTGYLELDANTTTYFIVRANINATATPGNTFQINGGSNPIVMENSGVAAATTNNQTNVAGIQTIGIPPAFSPTLVNISANTDGGLCTAVKAYAASVTGYPTPTITYVFSGATTGSGSGSGTGSVFNKGVTHVQLTASNGCEPSPTSMASFEITVSDLQNPTITAPAAVNVTTNTACTATGVTLGTPVTADNCSVASVTNNAPSAFPLGATTVTWTVTDGSGNTNTATQLITVTDNINPTITSPANVNAFTNTNCTATGVMLGTPVTADNCSVASVTNNAPSAFPLGATTVTWTVTDGSGNTNTATQLVTVTDNINPTITSPANVNAFTNTNCTATGVTLGTPVTADNCSVASITNNAPSAFPLGAITVTWTVTDGSGNTNTATQLVTVTDNINPTITAPVPVNATTNTACTATGVTLGTPVTADNCSVASVTNNAPSAFSLGATTVTWTVTDGSGNTNTATQLVTVTDNINPTITAPAPVNASTNTACTATGVTLGNPVTADNCSVASVTNNAPSAFPLGATTVTWTVTDGSGNTNTATQTVTVTDNVKPTMIAPTAVNITTNTGCTATGVSLGTASATDNCTASLVITNNAPAVFPLGQTTVTWTATDAAGNTQTATQTVTVTDNINPTITAPAPVNATTNTACTATGVTIGTPVTADNCSVASVTNNAPSAFPLGATTVIWTVTDGSGNTNTATQLVTVTDNIPPVAPTLSDVTGQCSVNPAVPTINDACAGVINGTTSTTLPVTQVGTTVITWTFSDGNGNSVTANQNVIVTGSNIMASANTSSVLNVSAGDNEFYDASCNLITKLNAETISGSTESKVWIESAALAAPYVKRHYQITPDNGASTAKGTVTLYFTQAEFDEYNGLVTSAPLPANATDAAGKANLRIAKFAGTSLDASGLTYGGAATPIDPDDDDIVFINNRWEVTFYVNGFSGFFVNSYFTPLPVTLVSFTGKKTGSNEVVLHWVTSDEKEFDKFEIQRSADAKSFESIGSVKSNVNTGTVLKSYQFSEQNNTLGHHYYRLKMVDKDRTFSYSRIIQLESSSAQSVIGQFYPNPTITNDVTVDLFAAEQGEWTIRSYDLTGRLLKSEVRNLKQGLHKVKLDLKNLSLGTALIQFESKGNVVVRKVIKQ